MKDFEYIEEDRLLRVYCRTSYPVLKGVRAKAQKYLKSKGVNDAWCFVESVEPNFELATGKKGSITTLKVYSPSLELKYASKGVRL